MVVLLYVIAGQAYEPVLRPRLFGAFSTAWVIPALVGPLVAGLVTTHVGWRLVFLGLLPLIVVGALLVVSAGRSFASPENPAAAAPARRWWAALAGLGIAVPPVRGPAPGPARPGARRGRRGRPRRRAAAAAAGGNGPRARRGCPRRRLARSAGRGVLRHGRAAAPDAHLGARLQPDRGRHPADRRRARLGGGLQPAGAVPRPAAGAAAPGRRRAARVRAGRHRPRRSARARRLAGVPVLGGRRSRHGAGDAQRRRPAAQPVAGAPAGRGLRGAADRRRHGVRAVHRTGGRARRRAATAGLVSLPTAIVASVAVFTLVALWPSPSPAGRPPRQPRACPPPRLPWPRTRRPRADPWARRHGP